MKSSRPTSLHTYSGPHHNLFVPQGPLSLCLRPSTSTPEDESVMLTTKNSKWSVQSTRKRARRTSSEKATDKRRRVSGERESNYKSSGWTCINKPSVFFDEENGYSDEAKTEAERPASRSVTPITKSHPPQPSEPTSKVKTAEEIRTMLTHRIFPWTLSETKRLVFFIKHHKTALTMSNKDAFNDLLSKLGFDNEELGNAVLSALRTKTRAKMRQLVQKMQKSGAITGGADAMEDNDGFENSGGGALVFARWTDSWFIDGWDGSLSKPSRKGVEGEIIPWAPEYEAKDYDDDLEVFEVEELPESPEYKERWARQEREDTVDKAPPEKRHEAVIKKDNETMSAEDWNYLVVQQQHLGYHVPRDIVEEVIPKAVKEVPPASQVSPSIEETAFEPSSTPVRLGKVASTSPQTISPAVTDKSISLGGIDSESDIDHERIIHETDAESEQYEDEDDQIEGISGTPAADTAITSPDPVTPARHIRAQSMGTPGSAVVARWKELEG